MNDYYNVKIVHYPETGETSLAMYEKWIGPGPKESAGIDNSRMEDIDPELRAALDRKNEKRSLRNTKQEMTKYARANLWEHWLTLTFDEKLVDREDYDECVKKFQGFMRKMKYKSPGIEYLAIPEAHPKKYKESGRITWHIHVLTMNLKESLLTDSGRVKVGRKKVKRESIPDPENYKTIYNLPEWSWGFSVVEKLDEGSSARASNYALNAYITKELIARTKNKKRFFASQGLKKAEEYKLNIKTNGEKLNLYNLIKPYCQMKPKITTVPKSKTAQLKEWEKAANAAKRGLPPRIYDFSDYYQKAVYYELKGFEFDSPEALQEIIGLMEPTMPEQRDEDRTEQMFICDHVLS